MRFKHITVGQFCNARSFEQIAIAGLCGLVLFVCCRKSQLIILALESVSQKIGYHPLGQFFDKAVLQSGCTYHDSE